MLDSWIEALRWDLEVDTLDHLEIDARQSCSSLGRDNGIPDGARVVDLISALAKSGAPSAQP